MNVQKHLVQIMFSGLKYTHEENVMSQRDNINFIKTENNALKIIVTIVLIKECS